MSAEGQLKIKILWFDEHLVELRVSAANRDFSGNAVLYETHDFASRLRAAVAGFPSATDDVRKFELGDVHGQGGVALRLRCLDATGHARLQVSLSKDGSGEGGLWAKVQLSIPVVAGAVDRFSARLEEMKLEVGWEAVLSSEI